MWDIITCKINTNNINSSMNDVIWLHPNYINSNCLMYFGGNKNNCYYSLTNKELNTINASNNVIIYLVDYYVN